MQRELNQPLCDPEDGSQALRMQKQERQGGAFAVDVFTQLLHSDCLTLWSLSVRELYALLFAPLWCEAKCKQATWGRGT